MFLRGQSLFSLVRRAPHGARPDVLIALNSDQTTLHVELDGASEA